MRGFHIGLVILLGTMVLAGFWPYYVAVARGHLEFHWLIHLHAVVFSGWMLLLFAQVLLVYRGRVATHRKLGGFGIAYGGLLIVLGCVISIAAPVLNVMAGRSTVDEAAAFLILPAGDMVLFIGFFTAAVALRRRPELHKRLMVLASIVLVFPAVARFAFSWGIGAVLIAWLLPLGLAMVRDQYTRGRIERVYWLGLALLLAAFGRVLVMDDEIWLGVGRYLLYWVLPADHALPVP